MGVSLVHLQTTCCQCWRFSTSGELEQRHLSLTRAHWYQTSLHPSHQTGDARLASQQLPLQGVCLCRLSLTVTVWLSLRQVQADELYFEVFKQSIYDTEAVYATYTSYSFYYSRSSLYESLGIFTHFSDFAMFIGQCLQLSRCLFRKCQAYQDSFVSLNSIGFLGRDIKRKDPLTQSFGKQNTYWTNHMVIIIIFQQVLAKNLLIKYGNS